MNGKGREDSKVLEIAKGNDGSLTFFTYEKTENKNTVIKRTLKCQEEEEVKCKEEQAPGDTKENPKYGNISEMDVEKHF